MWRKVYVSGSGHQTYRRKSDQGRNSTISSAASGSRRCAAQYFDNLSPISGKVLCQVARSTAEDIELALDAAHAAKDAWGRASATERSNVLLKIADRIEANLSTLALVETLDNGKPIRETTYADVPLMADHFRYFAGVLARPGRRHFGNRPRHRRLSLIMSRSA